MEAGFDDSRHQSAIISPNSLIHVLAILYIQDTHSTHLNTLGIHLIVLFGLRPIQPGVSLLVDEQIGEIDLFKLQFDGFNEFLRDEGGSLTSCVTSRDVDMLELKRRVTCLNS